MSDNQEWHFGGCPECSKSNGFLYRGRENWFICDTHLTRWHVGDNLFSGWREMSEEELAEQADQLLEYRIVEPVHPEPPETFRT